MGTPDFLPMKIESLKRDLVLKMLYEEIFNSSIIDKKNSQSQKYTIFLQIPLFSIFWFSNGCYIW